MGRPKINQDSEKMIPTMIYMSRKMIDISRVIAKEQNRSTSGQIRQFVSDGIKNAKEI